MAEVAFDNDIILKHSTYRQCGSMLDTVSKKDYPGDDFFDKRIACLDMDAYETIVCKGAKDCTMDAVIGIKDFSDNRFHDTRLLLIELRMDYKSDKNLSKTKLEQKVCHTRSLLGGETKIDETSCFIFSNNIINKVRRWFNDKSKEGGSLRHCKPLSTDEFNEKIKSADLFPYTPLTNLPAMEKDLQNLLFQAQYSCFINKTEYWLKKALTYRQRYNNEEYRHITEVIEKVWYDFRKSTPTLSDDERLDVEILEEDFDILRKNRI